MGRTKALLHYAGETFLDRLIRLFAVHCSPVIVVLGAHAAELRAALAAPQPAILVDNPEWPQGQITSLQCGLRALPPGVDAVLFTLVDHPAVEPATVAALTAPPYPLLRVPRYGERHGHPLLIGRELIAEFLAVTRAGSARDVVHRHRAHTEYVDVADPGIVADIDDPAAFRALSGGGAK